ncbi:hypothetical protein CFN78_06725 [Amycolatopsis antarctica]|uniref:Uncharacterized protein n=1 Tax=Amycolatopsis antarctica TaxID=1854586 RepID=A0A263D923_9PSEU|nr:hypothetical protein [Amycolatopsis antarctica]OZM73976.1 hypothetical protein CFN78_06725 [Amycolatopsis antarctica]
MIWATPAEVTAYLDADPSVTQREVDKAVRTIEPKTVRRPRLDPDTLRAEDETVRGHLVAAVAELIAARRTRAAQDAALDQIGGGAGALLAEGGSISTNTLTVAGPRTAGGNARSRDDDGRLPMAVIEALAAAYVIGGGVASW